MFVAHEMCDEVAFINEGALVALDSPRALKLRFGQGAVVMTDRGTAGFGAMVKQDLIMAYRNGLVLVAVVISTVLIVLTNFVFPKSAKLSATEYVVDSTPDRFVASYLQMLGKGGTLLDSEDELRQRVKDDPVAVGGRVQRN